VAKSIVAEGGTVSDVRPVGGFAQQIVVLVQSGGE
jgi:hypothetical protein